jgi:metal-responsive CopG/Arc/MetJ family transcriptional regulator
MESTALIRRINISLPEETLRVLNRAIRKGQRSRFIDEALRSRLAGSERSEKKPSPLQAAERYVENMGRTELRRALAERARRNAKRDQEIAAEWDPIADEIWRRG